MNYTRQYESNGEFQCGLSLRLRTNPQETYVDQHIPWSAAGGLTTIY